MALEPFVTNTGLGPFHDRTHILNGNGLGTVAISSATLLSRPGFDRFDELLDFIGLGGTSCYLSSAGVETVLIAVPSERRSDH